VCNGGGEEFEGGTGERQGANRPRQLQQSGGKGTALLRGWLKPGENGSTFKITKETKKSPEIPYVEKKGKKKMGGEPPNPIKGKGGAPPF